MLHKVVFSYLFLGFLRMSRFALFTGLQDAEISQKHFQNSLLIGGAGAQLDIVVAALNNLSLIHI